MEGKIVILNVLIMSLVIAQIQVEAIKSCCPNEKARRFFNSCTAARLAPPYCTGVSGCILFPTTYTCPPEYPANDLDNSADAVNEYCKLGCTSSVCSPLTTLQDPDTKEVVDGKVDQCAKACSTLCTKGSTKIAVETA